MKKNTRFAFNAFLVQLARVYKVEQEELHGKFSVEPSVAQTLEDTIQQSTAFLTLINVIGVTDQSGQLLGLGVGSTIAGTTDTGAKEREPTDPTDMSDSGAVVGGVYRMGFHRFFRTVLRCSFYRRGAQKGVCLAAAVCAAG